MSATDARELAMAALLRVEAGAPSDRALDDVLKRSAAAAADRRLATELVYGSLRRQRRIDALLGRLSRRPLGSLDKAVLIGLRLGAYQIGYLDSVPDHAAVDRSIEAIKRRSPGGAGFANAVLRAALRGGVLSIDEREASPFDDVPGWWGDRWRQRFDPDQAAAWLAATLRPPPLVLRVHPRVAAGDEVCRRLGLEGIVARPSRHSELALEVVEGKPLASALLAEGAFSPRSLASQLVAGLLPVAAGDRVLDVCAGRGGKAIQIAEDRAPAAVIAADLAPWRAAACRAAAARARVETVLPLVADACRPGPFAVRFEAILVDAPCSGLGTVRRHPEIKWRNDPERIDRLAALQRRILSTAAAHLAPGGHLLYATCSTEREENEEVVVAVLAESSDLEAVPVEIPAGADSGLVDSGGYFRTYPAFPEMDGFFAALLRRG